MAFLLERPHSQDVYAATDGVRVLSLSEATLPESAISVGERGMVVPRLRGSVDTS